MDRTIWKIVLQAIHHAHRRLPKASRRPEYPDWLIVAMFLWSVWHQRPLSWACQRDHYGDLFRPRKIPSVSQFTRRIKTSRCQEILQRVHDELARSQVASPVSYLRMPMLADDSLVMGDGNLDSNIYKLIAFRNGRLLAPPKGMAQHPVTLRQMGAARREALEVWRESQVLAKLLLRQRIAVENIFSRICELTRLPAWVRGLPRVTRWAGGVLILYHARLQARKPLRAAAA